MYAVHLRSLFICLSFVYLRSIKIGSRLDRPLGLILIVDVLVVSFAYCLTLTEPHVIFSLFVYLSGISYVVVLPFAVGVKSVMFESLSYNLEVLHVSVLPILCSIKKNAISLTCLSFGNFTFDKKYRLQPRKDNFKTRRVYFHAIESLHQMRSSALVMKFRRIEARFSCVH